MTGQMSSFFDEMLEAAKAKEALPTIQAERDHAISRQQFLEQRVEHLGNMVAQLQSQLDAKEVALRDATKSATSNKGNLDLLLDEVRKAMGQVMVATDIVDPKPVEPEVVELPNPLGTGQSAQTTGGDTSRPTTVADDGREYYVQQPPFVDPTSSTGNGPSTGIGEATQTPSGQSDANPTVTPSAPAQDSPAPTTTASPTDASTSPFKPDPKPYWLKPSNLTWGEWKERGNDVPYWASDDADVMNTV